MRIKIAIAIPTYERDEVLLRTIEQALTQTRQADEVIVVDQTADHVPHVAAELNGLAASGRIRYLTQKSPSLPAARNYALSATECDVIIFIDDDVELPVNFIAEHEKNYISGSTIHAVAGGVDQRLGWPKKKRPDAWVRALDYSYFFLGGHERVESVANFLGANHSVLVKVARRLKGYDERFRGVALREESDLALRIYHSGGKIVFDPSARLFHIAAPTGGCRKKSPLDMQAARSNLFFAMKHIGKLRCHFIRELWFSIRLGVLNKANIKNPIYLTLCSLRFAYLLVEIPISILTKETTARFK